MLIAIDIRPLQEGVGGVYEYTLNIIRALLATETRHRYVLCASSWKKKSDSNPLPEEGPYHRIIEFGIPSKILNTALMISRRPFFDDLIKRRTGNRPDLFFLPNINFFSIRPNIPVVLTVHDLSYIHYPHLLRKKSYVWHRAVYPHTTMKKMNHFLAVSHYSKRDLVQTLGVSEESVTVTHLDSDPSFLDIAKKSESNKKFFLLFGAHEKRKNGICAIRAFSLFIKRYSGSIPYVLVLVGNEVSLKKMYGREIKKLCIESRIELRNTVSQHDRIALYHEAALLLYPSLYEGFGLPLVEAARMGVPSIAGASSSIGEVIDGGTLLVDPYNIHEMAEAMHAIVEQPALRDHLVARARIKVQDYSWTKAAHQTREVFERFESVPTTYHLPPTS